MVDGNSFLQLKRIVSELCDENEDLRQSRDRERERSAKLSADLVTCLCKIRQYHAKADSESGLNAEASRTRLDLDVLNRMCDAALEGKRRTDGDVGWCKGLSVSRVGPLTMKV